VEEALRRIHFNLKTGLETLSFAFYTGGPAAVNNVTTEGERFRLTPLAARNYTTAVIVDDMVLMFG
jgi:hypothetical protein